MSLSCLIYNRSALDRVQILDSSLVLTPQRLSWSMYGGPESADVDMAGSENSMLTMLNHLADKIEIQNDLGLVVWVGIINEVTIPYGPNAVTVSLDAMYNTAKVVYTYDLPDGSEDSDETSWYTNDDSIDRFGAKEIRYISTDKLVLTSATTLAGVIVDELGAAVPAIEPGGTGRGVLRCVGLLDTLNWRYYEQLRGWEYHDETGSDTQTIGVGETQVQFYFEGPARLLHDVGDEEHGYQVDNKIVVSGSVSNDGVYTIEGGGEQEEVEYTATTISFEANDDILDSADGFHDFSDGDTIQVYGSASNSGLYRLVSDEYDNHLEVNLKEISAESAGPSITIKKGSWLELTEGLTTEGNGVTSITITAWGEKIAQSFSLTEAVAEWDVHEISLRIRRVGTITDNITVGIQGDSGGAPNGVYGDYETVDGTELPTELDWHSFDLAGDQTLTYGTTYWLVIERSGANDPNNYYEVGVDEDNGYANGTMKLYDGSAWQNRNVPADLNFNIWGEVESSAALYYLVAAIGDRFDVVGENTGGGSGQMVRLYRDGTVRGADEAKSLMQQRCDDGDYLLVDCADYKSADIYRVSKDYDQAIAWRLADDGRLLDSRGGPLPEAINPVAKWVYVDMDINRDSLADPVTFLIAHADYEVGSGTYTLQSVNSPDVFDIGENFQG